MNEKLISEQVRAKLDNSFGKDFLPMEQWFSYSDHWIKSNLRQEVISNLPINFNSKLELTGSDNFKFQNAFYNFQCDIVGRTVKLTISKVFEKKEKLSRLRNADISSFGNYNSISVKLSDELIEFQEFILEFSKNFIDTVYSWIYYKIDSKIDKIQSKIAYELYQKSYSIIPSKSIYHCWFWIVVDNQGFYITTQHARTIASENLKSFSQKTNINPSDLFIKFTTNLLEFRNTVSEDAFKDNIEISISLSKTKYQESGIPIAEEGVYSNSVAKCIPLVDEGRLKLSMGMPIQVSNEISSYIQSNKGIYKSFIKSNKNNINSVVKGMANLTKPSTLKLIDIIDVKPNFFGIGGNLNNLIKWYQEKRHHNNAYKK